MNETKHPLQSKTVWIALFQVGVSFAVGSGILTAEQGTILETTGPEVAVGLFGSLFAAASLWGRLTAKSQLQLRAGASKDAIPKPD